MNPTTEAIVDRAHLAHLALRTGDYRDLRRALDHLSAFPIIPAGIVARLAVRELSPAARQKALEVVHVHGGEVFGPDGDGLRRELLDALEEVIVER